MNQWFLSWSGSFEALKTIKDIPVSIHPNRQNYFEKAVEVLAADHPAAALWILLRCWTKAAAVLPKTDSPYKDWQAMIHQLDLDSKGLPGRLEVLDTVLDRIEESVDQLQQTI
jgi:hypothetical protein